MSHVTCRMSHVASQLCAFFAAARALAQAGEAIQSQEARFVLPAYSPDVWQRNKSCLDLVANQQAFEPVVSPWRWLIAKLNIPGSTPPLRWRTCCLRCQRKAVCA